MSETTRTREEIESEIRGLEQLMRSHDYIGTKIAMGRATREEYAEQIAQSEEWAQRVDQLRRELDELDEEE